MQKITPFLWYSKEAEEAAAFYASIFPDSRVTRVTALPSESPSGPPGSVKIVEFVLFGQPFMAMSAVRLAQGSLRPVVADRSDRSAAHDGRPRSSPGQAGLGRDDEHGQDRHQGA